MMFRLGGWEWIIILVIVLLLFGPGRIGKIAGELGKGIKSFRDGLGGDKKDDQSTDSNGNIEPK
ncbi:MAG: twin-arginine translocase TatA/TatE family subunit [Anaerolineales bacterium]|nr:twin-arginine translocase TatA/TatE family subunit [Anaerolineae bacterium]PWB78000.1 MAG: twin-arginine translocase TatA/TatE family subunit [Anaerolineales bacterium]